MTDRNRLFVSQYVKSWQPATPSKRYFTDFAGGGVLWVGSSYKWHIFTSSGTWTAPVTNADVIVVAGGGGTGLNGGGGGAGGVRNLIAATFVVGTTYTVTVGAGGSGSTAHAQTSGGNSSITTSGATISATGGGRGGSSSTGAANGGSGGGAHWTLGTAGTGNAGGYTPVEGYNGGTATISGGGASGGGGGSNTTTGLGAGKNGAAGKAWGGGNTGQGGAGGGSLCLPADLNDCPLLASYKRNVWDSGYGYMGYGANAQVPPIMVAQGGGGYGYAGQDFANYANGGVGGMASAYNTTVIEPFGFGCGGAGGAERGTAGMSGIVIVRYAL